MKVKNLKIEIRPLDGFVDDTIRAFNAIKEGKKVFPDSAIVFPDVETLRKVLTNKRLEILKAIKKNNPESIYELAKIVNRPLRSVQDDVKILVDLGLIEIEKTSKERKKAKPLVPYQGITIEIGL